MNIFKISTNQITNHAWVTWPNFGVVRSDTGCEKLLNLAFEASPEQVGIFLSNGDEHWLSSLEYYKISGSLDEMFKRVSLRPLIGIGFNNTTTANIFVKLAEQYIIMNVLSNELSNELDDF